MIKVKKLATESTEDTENYKKPAENGLVFSVLSVSSVAKDFDLRV